MDSSMNVNVRIDRTVKSDADKILSDMGLTFSGAVNLFMRRVVSEKKMPFELRPYVSLDERISAAENGTANIIRFTDEQWEKFSQC